ncbi:MAG: Arc family DNA-binding protein [Bacteroidales bacterium]|jgi:hypothetical protein|nr:Arc family DNA-binding protein [Bacteroidales bacterium]
MDKKKPFVLRLHPEMMKRLEKWASDEFRSINGQIEWILHQALKKSGRLKKTEKDKENKEPD